MMYRKRYFVSAVLLLGTVLLSAQTPTIKGNVFGGGRMASVGTQDPGTTAATVTVNASSIQGGVYGGNDITGTVNQGTTASAGVTINNVAVSVNEVYGGGNGYYQYRLPSGTVLKPGDVTQDNASTAIAQGTSVKVFNVGESDYSDANTIATFTAPSGCTYSTLMPVVDKTSVSVGSATGASGIDIADVYGGAKNAKVSSSSCTVKSGTIERVFAGNNVGGSIGTTSLQILGTNTSGTPDWTNAGKGFGIGEAYGGGNAVSVSGSTEIDVQAGQVGKAFGGNNLADMYIVPSVYIKGGTIDIVYGGGNAGNMKGVDYGTIDYSKYISNLSLPTAPTKMENQILPLFAGTDVMIDNTAAGSAGATVNSVYGGCRAANVDNSTYIRLTKGTVGNLFGGCDIAGSVGFAPGTLSEAVTFRTYLGGDAWADVKYSDGTTVFKLGDKSNNKDMVYASTYLKINGGTVGNVYGSGNGNYSYSASGNTVTVKNLAGTTTLATFDNSRHGEPFVTSARVCIEGGSVTGNIYGGGLNATLGHVITQTDINNADAAHKSGSKYKMYGKEYAVGDIVSRTSYLFLGTGTAMTIPGNIFGGGCLANVYGTMDIIVKANTTLSGALYAGNDASGSVMGTGRGDIQATAGESGVTYGTMLMDPSRDTTGLKPWESYGGTTLTHDNAQTYVRVEEGAVIANLYGGGNGDYTYGTPSGGKVEIKTKGSSPKTIGYAIATDKEAAHPSQISTWVDVAGTVTSAYGGGNAADIESSNLYIARNAKIHDAYGGGNSATVTKAATVTVDCNAATANPSASSYNVYNLFGGNNTADMAIVPRMYLQRGSIYNAYGGGNAGNMTGWEAGTVDYSQFIAQESLPTGIYSSILPLFAGTDVMVDSDYGKDPTTHKPIAGQTCGLRIENVFGGCRAANVDNSTYIRITHADYVGNVYGGCDIAGSVGLKPGTLDSPVTFQTYTIDGGGFTDVKIPGTDNPFTLDGDMIYASTYVTLTGGTVDKNMFGSGNGNYQYVVDGTTTRVYPLEGGTTGTPLASFNNTKISEPFVTSSRLSVEGGTVKGNVYGGGLKAELGHRFTPAEFTAMGISGSYRYYDRNYSNTDTLSRTSYLFFGHTGRAMTDSITILGDVYGGGCLANVYGTMDIIVKKGVKLNNLYAGNDAAGNVAGTGRGQNQASAGTAGVHYGTMLYDYKNSSTPWTSFLGMKLDEQNASTYIRVEDSVRIANVFGGGNGDYTYGTPSNGLVSVSTKGSSPRLIGYTPASSIQAAHPNQSSTFMDIAGIVTGAAYGGGNAANNEQSNICIVHDAKVNQAFGGGNSATVTEKANIWVDCTAALTNATASDYNVQTLFGGNNLAAMDILPTIYLWCGKIGTVYGGGNAGDMRGHDAFALDYTAYKDNTCLTEGVVKTVDNVKWLPMFSATEVLVDSPYKLTTKDDALSKTRLQANPTTTDLELQSGLRINAVYGGCKAANIDNSTYTRITRADYVGAVYGGNDIAGTVGMKPGTYTSGTKFVVYKVDKTNGDQTRAELGTLDFTAGKLMTNSGSYVCVTGGVMPGNVFGGGNGEAYTDTYSSLGRPFSSATLVMLEGGTVNGNVFGGGNQADVKYSLMTDGTASTTPSDAYKTANPFCNNSHIFIGETSRRKSDVVLTNVFGGGNQAGVAGNTHVDIDGSTISGAVYGGCNSSGTVAGNSKVTLHKGTIGASGTGTANNNVLFGGGLGSGTSVTNDVFVTVNGGTINGTIYGGGSQGIVNTNCNNVTSTTVNGGIITGDIYGGALQANINGQIQMNVTGGTFRSIFAANNQGGLPKCDIALNYSADGDCESAIYGGGNEADFTGNTQVVFNKGRIGYIYGGANMANVTGNTYVYILGGEICHDVFGGGKGVAGEDNGNVSGSTNVYVLDDRLDASGNYVISKDASGNTKTASAGPVLTIGSGAEQNFPEQPKGWTESMRSSINIKGNIYGGGSNGNVGGKTNVVIGSGK